MKKSLCFYFQVHQPVRLRQYRFFDIGKRHDYFDDYMNRSTIRRIAEDCYLPANKILLDLIYQNDKKFKVSFSISGAAIEQFEMHAPEVIESFKELAKTGCVEFLAETYNHSLASLSETDEFEMQVYRHTQKITELFGKRPETFRNSSLIYSDQIGDRVAKMGFKTMLTDGAKHILGWRSPNFVYTNSINPNLKLLLKNSRLSDDITLRFSDKSWSEWPLTADKYASWLDESVMKSDVVSLFMNYETFGEYQKANTGIMDFLHSLPEFIIKQTDLEFLTPAEIVEKHKAVGPLYIPYPISWSDEERDVTGWLGNELQSEAFEELFKIQPKKQLLNDPELNADYDKLQASDHFYFMGTKLFSGSGARYYHSPYDSPYEAFINYMNILSDFIARVNNKMENEDKLKSPQQKKRNEKKELELAEVVSEDKNIKKRASKKK